MSEKITCPDCEGTGDVWQDHRTVTPVCPTCKGEGCISEENHDELEWEEVNELIAAIEHAVGECSFIAHCSANALGQIRFKTHSGQVLEIDLSDMDQFENWKSRRRI